MNTSAKQSTISLVNPLMLLALAAAAICYFLPWITHGYASMTFGGYDLAEWTSLHPAVRFVEPALQTTLWLRLPPVFMLGALMFSIAVPRFSSRWWFLIFVVLIISAALLPPFEFIIPRDDPNYRQQTFVAGAALIIGMAGLIPWSRRIQQGIVLALCAAAILSALIGLSNSIALMQGFELSPQIGVGGVGFVIALGAAAVISLRRLTATL